MKRKLGLGSLAIIFITSSLSGQITKPTNGGGRAPIGVISTVQIKPPPANTTTVITPENTPVNNTPVATTPTIVKDKDDMIEISGITGTVFTSYNNYDGSPASYNQLLQISIGLLPVMPGGSYNFSLIFYSPADKISQAAYYDQGVLNIFYPLAMYGDIKDKISQSLHDNKKIYVRVIQKIDGYREGSIIF